MREYFKASLQSDAPALRELIDRPLFVPATLTVPELIECMNREKLSLAIVQDETGRICGMLTVEDALEELISDLDLGEEQPIGGEGA